MHALGPGLGSREVYRRVDAPPQRHSGLKTGQGAAWVLFVGTERATTMN